MSAIRVQRINTILYCRRWRPTVAFYRDVLGLEVHQATDWIVEFKLTADSFVSIADERRATIRSDGGAGLTLTWQVADVVSLHDALMAKEVNVGPVKVRWGARVFYFHDPEGHRIELWSP